MLSLIIWIIKILVVLIIICWLATVVIEIYKKTKK